MSDESEDTDDERGRDRERETGLDTERDADVEIDADADSDADTAGDAAGEDTPFEQQEYEEVDVDEVLVGPADGDADSETAPEAEPETESATDESEEAAINVIESRICHNCPYFGEPPELHCTHEGTQIRKVVDTDHYVVVDCPVVVEELEF